MREVIKSLYKEVMAYGLDNQGCNKYNDMMKHDDVSREDTPFSVRTVTNGVVKGGLNYMLDEFDKTVNRIRKENPTRKVYYVRKEIKVNPNPKPNPTKEIQVAALNTTEDRDKRDIELDKKLMNIIDFKNKDPTKTPCYFCRNVIVYWKSCNSHSFQNC